MKRGGDFQTDHPTTGNAWASARGFKRASAVTKARHDTFDYFVEQYRKMREQNLDNYSERFDKFVGT